MQARTAYSLRYAVEFQYLMLLSATQRFTCPLSVDAGAGFQTVCGRLNGSRQAERLATLVKAASGSDRPKLLVITDGANGLQSIAGRLPFSSTPILDWFHISMRVRYLEQIIKGMRATTETEKGARRVLISHVEQLRWCFWHARLEKAKTRMQGILTICRVIVPETPAIGHDEHLWGWISVCRVDALAETSEGLRSCVFASLRPLP
jgi:hypothetical protein